MLEFLIVLLCGLVSILYGVGMAFYTWFPPGHQNFSIFKPRWNYAVKASRRAAYAQVPLFISFGAGCLSSYLHFEHTQVFGFLFLVFAAFGFIFFVADFFNREH